MRLLETQERFRLLFLRPIIVVIYQSDLEINHLSFSRIGGLRGHALEVFDERVGVGGMLELPAHGRLLPGVIVEPIVLLDLLNHFAGVLGSEL